MCVDAAMHRHGEHFLRQDATIGRDDRELGREGLEILKRRAVAHRHRLKNGDILIHGHTHVLKAEKREDYTLLNPGSVSIPKEGNPPSYAILEDGLFTIKGFDGTIIKELQL